MMKLFQKIQNTGIDSKMDFDTAKRIRFVNAMSIITIIMASGVTIYSLLSGWPLKASLLLLILCFLIPVPIVLNRLNKPFASRLYFIFSSYVIILGLSVIFGPKLHFQYYLVGGIGIPLLFLGDEMGKKRLFLSVLAIIFWMCLEWYYSVFGPLIVLAASAYDPIRLINDLLVFLTVFSVVYFFIKENDQYLEKIKRKSRRLEEINDQLEQFSQVVSHDLKTPLGNIYSASELIKKEHSDEMSDKIISLFSIIEQSSERSVDLISSILEYSRVGKDEIEIKTFSINELLDHIYTFIKIPDTIKVLYDASMPMITGSYIQLEEVLTNLIGNAIKYHDKENGTIRIVCEPSGNNEVKIRVIDDGPGIKEKYQQLIFNLFESAHETKRADSTGIGLAIVKKLVEQSGGQVGLISAFGKGSTFWFTWPVDLRKVNRD